MKSAIGYVVKVVLGCFLVYLIVAGTSGEYDMVEWNTEQRTVSTLFFLLVFVISLIQNDERVG